MGGSDDDHFPGNAMVEFPVGWAVYDTERAWIVCEIRNVMRDPGDGSVHETPNLTILHYAGENLFSYEEDVYNPMNFAAMVTGWARVADAHGRLPDDGRQLARAVRTDGVSQTTVPLRDASR